MSARIFFSADYDGLELRTMAQSAINLVGYSKLADALNAGRDPHLELAATLFGLDYQETLRRYELGDKHTDSGRQTGKITNFGLGGGMGKAKFAFQAKKQYKVILCGGDPKAKHVECCEHRAAELKEIWYRTWPEMREYHRLAGRETEDGDCVFEHFYSGRLRGGLGYTQRCNTPFQGLGADATGNALWLVSRACYEPTACAACDGAILGCPSCRAIHGPGISPLYGSRIVNYVHDELIGECWEAWGHEVAHELVRVMVRGAAPYLPDAPATAKPLLMRFWSKDAKQVWLPLEMFPRGYCGEKGKRLVAWEYGFTVSSALEKMKKWELKRAA